MVTNTQLAAKYIGKNKELFLDYGQAYWAEGSFEDYLAGRGERRDSIGGAGQEAQRDESELTYGSETAEGT